jgi:hypothetical protein
MTTKEKALELIYKYLSVYDIIPIAKECALILVDEIIKLLVDLSNGRVMYINEIRDWQEVKKEIIKLNTDNLW